MFVKTVIMKLEADYYNTCCLPTISQSLPPLSEAAVPQNYSWTRGCQETVVLPGSPQIRVGENNYVRDPGAEIKR